MFMAVPVCMIVIVMSMIVIVMSMIVMLGNVLTESIVTVCATACAFENQAGPHDKNGRPDGDDEPILDFAAVTHVDTKAVAVVDDEPPRSQDQKYPTGVR